MKKILYLTLIGMLAVVLTACSGDEETKEKEETESSEEKSADAEKKASADAEKLQKKLEEQKVKEDKIVAVVNSNEIKGKEYNSLLMLSQRQSQQRGQDPTSEKVAKQLKTQVIDGLVGNELIIQAADENGYKATEEEINKKLEEEKARFENEEKFQEALKSSGMSLDDLKKDIAESVKYTAYINEKVQVEEVSEEEIKTYYDKISEQASSEELPKYEEVKDKIKTQLQNQKKQTKIGEKVAELKKEAEVEILI